MSSTTASIEHATGLTAEELDAAVRQMRDACNQVWSRQTVGSVPSRARSGGVHEPAYKPHPSRDRQSMRDIEVASAPHALAPHASACRAEVTRCRPRPSTAWIVDGTLVPTRDHSTAAKSKNYRWSCNAQVLVRGADLRVIAVVAGGPGNRNDTVHYRGSTLQTICQSKRRVLADGGYRGVPSW